MKRDTEIEGEGKQRGSADAKKFSPWAYHVVGWDRLPDGTLEGPETPGYDEQIFSLTKQDWEDFVDGIEAADGEILEPILYRNNGTRKDVWEGRKRVIGSRLYMERMGQSRESNDGIVVPGIAKREGDDSMLAMQVIGNECRINRTTLQKARLAHKCEKRGWTDDRICKAFGGIKLSTLKLWRRGLELDDAVLKLIDQGKMKFHAATLLLEFPRAEQYQRAVAMVEAGATTVPAARAQQLQGRNEAEDGQTGGKSKGKGASRGARTPGAFKPASKPQLTKVYNETGRAQSLKCSPASILEWALGLAGPPPEIAKIIATKEPGGKTGQKAAKPVNPATETVRKFVQQPLMRDGK